jgi:phage-related tail protein
LKVGIGSYGAVELVLVGADVDVLIAVESEDVVVKKVVDVEDRSEDKDVVKVRDSVVEVVSVVEWDMVEERDSVVEEAEIDDAVDETADDVSEQKGRQSEFRRNYNDILTYPRIAADTDRRPQHQPPEARGPRTRETLHA